MSKYHKVLFMYQGLGQKKRIFNRILLDLKFISGDLTNLLINSFYNFVCTIKGCFSIPFYNKLDHTLVLWFRRRRFCPLPVGPEHPRGTGEKHDQRVCFTPFTFLLLGWVSYPLLNTTLSVGCHCLSGDCSSSFVRPQTQALLGTPA